MLGQILVAVTGAVPVPVAGLVRRLQVAVHKLAAVRRLVVHPAAAVEGLAHRLAVAVHKPAVVAYQLVDPSYFLAGHQILRGHPLEEMPSPPHYS